jgi:hypothetical protein
MSILKTVISFNLKILLLVFFHKFGRLSNILSTAKFIASTIGGALAKVVEVPLIPSLEDSQIRFPSFVFSIEKRTVTLVVPLLPPY